MKRGMWLLSAAGALLAAFALGRAQAQEGVDDEMQACMELGKPGPEHADLMKFVGTWKVESKMWTKPGEPPVSSSGIAVFTSLFNGRYLRQDVDGLFLGAPFRGTGLMGFNNATRQYEDVWIDSNSTGIMHSTGTRAADGKRWEFTGSCAGPGGKEMKMRSTITRVSDDQFSAEAFCDVDGSGETKCWEATYTRAK